MRLRNEMDFPKLISPNERGSERMERIIEVVAIVYSFSVFKTVCGLENYEGVVFVSGMVTLLENGVQHFSGGEEKHRGHGVPVMQI